MRIAMLGGTRFIGAATVEELVDHGHDVVVVHRGQSELDDLPPVAHRHVDRHDATGLKAALVGAEVVVDTNAYTRADAQALVAALPAHAGAVVLSSMDVYRAFHRLNNLLAPIDRLPLDEGSPTRSGDERYLFRGQEVPPGVGAAAMHDYENLDVEDVALAAGATVLRLPMVYGERDPMRREAFVLDRRHQERIEIGAGTLLWTKGYVRDVAAAIRLAPKPVPAPGWRSTSANATRLRWRRGPGRSSPPPDRRPSWSPWPMTSYRTSCSSLRR